MSARVGRDLAARVANLRRLTEQRPERPPSLSPPANPRLERWHRSVPHRYSTVRWPDPQELSDRVGPVDRLDRNVIVTGPPGTGKTRAAWSIAREAAALEVPGMVIRAGTLIDRQRPGGVDQQRLIDRTNTVRLLVVDDIGVNPQTEWSAARWDTLFDARWEAGLPTVLMSNLAAQTVERNPDGLAAWLGDRSWSRLAGRLCDKTGGFALRIELGGVDHRRT